LGEPSPSRRTATFITEHEAEAPLGYPEIHYLTSPLPAGSVRAGDPQAVNVWTGVEIVKSLT
jgi:nitronate monooxygenase